MKKATSPRWQFGKQRERRLFMQPLENRALLAADTFVNDNWFLKTDVDDSTTITAGDIVDNRLDVTGKATASGTFGTTAFSDINTAITATDNGGTVTVLEGTYTGNVNVNKPLTLEGANAGVSAGVDAETRGDETIIDGNITISADKVTIDGITLTGGADIVGDVAGIFLAAEASEATITNNIITGDGAGRGILSSANGNNVVIENNEISGWTTGIFNQSNDNVDVIGNLIHDNVSGVANDFVNNVLIEGNDFKDNDEAIGTFTSTDLEVMGNDLAENTKAIVNYGGEQVTATENFFGTLNLAEIDALVDGDVLTGNPLAESPFDVDEVADLVFTGNNGLMLTVNPETGDFEFTDGANLTITGTGARIQNGVLKIHTHDSMGRKVDIMGNVDGTIDVVLKQLGKGNKKQSFSLTPETEVAAV
jgi:nitrous oxidase accessory protein NosD